MCVYLKDWLSTENRNQDRANDSNIKYYADNGWKLNFYSMDGDTIINL